MRSSGELTRSCYYVYLCEKIERQRGREAFLSLYFFLTPLLLIKDSRVSLKDVSEADLNGIYNNLFTVLITYLLLMKR